MKPRCLILIAALALIPAKAHADWWDLMGFLDQLSGPGPFGSKTVVNPEARIPIRVGQSGDARVLADKSQRDLAAQIVQNTAPTGALYAAVRFSWLRTRGETLRFLDSSSLTNREPVHVFSFDPSLMYRAGKAVDVGVGVAFMRFSGEGFDTFWKTGLIAPKMTFSPLAFFARADCVAESPPTKCRWLHLVNVSVDGILVKGFSGQEDFKDPTTKYDTSRHHEYLLRAGLQIDLELPIFLGIRALTR